MKEEDENDSSSSVKGSGRISTCCQRICLWSLRALEDLGLGPNRRKLMWCPPYICTNYKTGEAMYV